MNIDVHAHMFPQSAARAHRRGVDWHGAQFDTAPDGTIVLRTGPVAFRWGPAYWEPLPDRLARMRSNSIDKQVISLTGPLFNYDADPEDARRASSEVNDEIAAMVADAGGSLAGLATLPLQDPRAAVAELARAMGDLGLAGASIGATVKGVTWDAPELIPILEAAHDLDAFILLHPTIDFGADLLTSYGLRELIGQPQQMVIAVSALIATGLLERLPRLKVCVAQGGGWLAFATGRLDHAARQWPEDRRSPSRLLNRLYFDSLTYDDRALRSLIDAVGVDRVMMGSDYPSGLSVADPVGFIQRSPLLSEAEKRAVLGENCARVLGL